MNMATADIKATLVEKYKCSKYETKARSRIREISVIVTASTMSLRMV